MAEYVLCSYIISVYIQITVPVFITLSLIDNLFMHFLSNNFYDIFNRTFTADSVLSGVTSVFEHSKTFDTKSVFAKDSVNYDQITVSNMHFCHLW